VVTRGTRRIGRTIRKLGNSVELSSKESTAKKSETKYREKARKLSGYDEDSPIQNIRDLLINSKESTKSQVS